MKFLEDKLRHLTPEDYPSEQVAPEMKKTPPKRKPRVPKQELETNPLLHSLLQDELREGM